MTKQKLLYFSDKQWKKIQKFKTDFDFKSDAKAIYALIDKGILADQASAPTVCIDHYDITEKYGITKNKERCFRCQNLKSKK